MSRTLLRCMRQLMAQLCPYAASDLSPHSGPNPTLMNGDDYDVLTESVGVGRPTLSPFEMCTAPQRGHGRR
jgi:hypothetical protein